MKAEDKVVLVMDKKVKAADLKELDVINLRANQEG